MKLLLTIISFSLLLSQQLQVDGNLKVTGEIDAQGNAIKNVGTPQAVTDALNLQTLNNMMTDDGVYEYKIILIKVSGTHEFTSLSGHEYGVNVENQWSTSYSTNLISFLESNWTFHKEIPLGVLDGKYKFLLILKRSIEDEE